MNSPVISDYIDVMTINVHSGALPQVDMSTPLLPKFVPEIDANPVSFYGGTRVGSVRFGVWLTSRFRLKICLQEKVAVDSLKKYSTLDSGCLLFCQYTVLYMPSWMMPPVVWTVYHKYLQFREFAKYGE